MFVFVYTQELTPPHRMFCGMSVMIEDIDGASLFRASVGCELRTVWPSGLQLFRALLGYAACYFASAFAQFKFFRLDQVPWVGGFGFGTRAKPCVRRRVPCACADGVVAVALGSLALFCGVDVVAWGRLKWGRRGCRSPARPAWRVFLFWFWKVLAVLCVNVNVAACVQLRLRLISFVWLSFRFRFGGFGWPHVALARVSSLKN